MEHLQSIQTRLVSPLRVASEDNTAITETTTENLQLFNFINIKNGCNVYGTILIIIMIIIIQREKMDNKTCLILL